MDREQVYQTIDAMRNTVGVDPSVDMGVVDRLCNYLEANVDEFLECYEDVDEE